MIQIHLGKKSVYIVESRGAENEVYCEGSLVATFDPAIALEEIKAKLIGWVTKEKIPDCPCIENNSGIDL